MTDTEFGRSPWGRAWIDAVEQQSRLDPSRLSRGRTYARQGKVFPVTIEPGSANADVEGSGADPYRAELDVRTLSDDEWRRLLEVIVAKVDHLAALVDGELDPRLVEDAAAVGVHLLPRGGEIETRCSCPDVVRPCKHAAALCYRVADRLDADPFALLELRGRTREQILAAVRRLRAESATAEDTNRPDGGAGLGDDTTPARPHLTPVDQGVEAVKAWARSFAPLPDAPSVRSGPTRPPAHTIEPPLDATFTAVGLETLSSDAAVRAWTALADGTTLGLDVGFDDDVIRRAATARHDPEFAEIARRLGTSTQALIHRAAAWEVGGQAGVTMANEDNWPADPLVMSAARLAVEEVLRGHIRGDIDGNRLTIGDIQLRLSQTGQWWSFDRQGDAWLLRDGPAEAADELVEPRPGRRR